MSHGVAKIHILHTPAVAFKLMHNYPMKISVVHGIVRVKSGGIIVIDDTVVGMRRIICAVVCNERRYFALKFYVERFEHIFRRLPRGWPHTIQLILHCSPCQYKTQGRHQCGNQGTSETKISKAIRSDLLKKRIAFATSRDCRSKALAIVPHHSPTHVLQFSHSSTPKRTKSRHAHSKRANAHGGRKKGLPESEDLVKYRLHLD